jgi:hypothetical protein
MQQVRQLLTHTSASQVEAYVRCPRFWFNRHVLKLPEPWKPAAEKGSKVHKTTEGFLRTGEIAEAEPEIKAIFLAGIANLPTRHPDLLIEQRFELPTYPGGPFWVGYVDLFDPRATPRRRVLDHKTTSDFRYCKTPQELLENLQLMAYGWWAFHTADDACWTVTNLAPETVDEIALSFQLGKVLLPELVAKYGPDRARLIAAGDKTRLDPPPWQDDEELEVSHLYLRTKRPYKAHPVRAIATRNQIETQWARALGYVESMARDRAAAAGADLDPNPASCGLYGGCHYRSLCGFTGSTAPSTTRQLHIINGKISLAAERKDPTMADVTAGSAGLTMSEKLARKKAEVAAAAAGTPPAPAIETMGGKVITQVVAAMGVVPPDAAPREEKVTAAQLGEGEKPAPAATEKPPATKKRSAAEKARDEITAAAATEGDAGATGTPIPENTPTPAPKATKRKPFVIYVDCMPTKRDEPEHVLLEEWLRPIVEKIAETHGLPDYRFIDFGKWRGPLSVLIREQIPHLPAVLVMSSFSPAAHDVLDVLTPYATRIVKAFKG